MCLYRIGSEVQVSRIDTPHYEIDSKLTTGSAPAVLHFVSLYYVAPKD